MTRVVRAPVTAASRFVFLVGFPLLGVYLFFASFIAGLGPYGISEDSMLESVVVASIVLGVLVVGLLPISLFARLELSPAGVTLRNPMPPTRHVDTSAIDRIELRYSITNGTGTKGDQRPYFAVPAFLLRDGTVLRVKFLGGGETPVNRSALSAIEAWAGERQIPCDLSGRLASRTVPPGLRWSLADSLEDLRRRRALRRPGVRRSESRRLNNDAPCATRTRTAATGEQSGWIQHSTPKAMRRPPLLSEPIDRSVLPALRRRALPGDRGKGRQHGEGRRGEMTTTDGGWEWFLRECYRWWHRNGIRGPVRDRWVEAVRARLTDGDDPVYLAAVDSWDDPRRLATTVLHRRVADPTWSIVRTVPCDAVFLTGVCGLWSPALGFGLALAFSLAMAIGFGALQRYWWGLGLWPPVKTHLVRALGVAAWLVLLVLLGEGLSAAIDTWRTGPPLAIALCGLGLGGRSLLQRWDPRHLAV